MMCRSETKTLSLAPVLITQSVVGSGKRPSAGNSSYTPFRMLLMLLNKLILSCSIHRFHLNDSGGKHLKSDLI